MNAHARTSEELDLTETDDLISAIARRSRGFIVAMHRPGDVEDGSGSIYLRFGGRYDNPPACLMGTLAIVQSVNIELLSRLYTAVVVDGNPTGTPPDAEDGDDDDNPFFSGDDD